MTRFTFGAVGAALLLTASLQAAEPSLEQRSDGGQLAQADRTRGFFGFSDWDGRPGSFRRRAEEPAAKKPAPRVEERAAPRSSGPLRFEMRVPERGAAPTFNIKVDRPGAGGPAFARWGGQSSFASGWRHGGHGG